MRITKAAASIVLLACACLSPSPALAQGAAVVTITSPANGSTVAGTVQVEAQVSPAGAAVVGVQFKLDDVDFGPEDTSAPYSVPWDTTSSNNGTRCWTAVARDSLGMQYTSDVVRVTVFNGAATATRFEETDLSTVYTVGWVHRVGDRPFSGGTAAYSPQTDGRATFTFTGTSVKWVGFRGPQTGIALVFLDGHFQAYVDTYSPTEQVKTVLYNQEGMENRQHTLWIEVTGLKNVASGGSLVVVDAFDVDPAAPPPIVGRRFEETDASSTFTSGWTQGDATAAWSGGTAASSATVGERATFTFSGTSFNWIGFRGPQAGIARVFLDGVFRGDVDLYEPTRLQAVVFQASQLEDTGHTLTIEVTGAKNPASTDSVVVIDAFDIRSRFEETHDSVAYSGTWEVTVSRAWSDKTAVFTWEAGATATFTFTGTSVRWIGYRGPVGGIARVFVDGQFTGEIDTYAANEEVQAVNFIAAGLVPGTHTIRIEVTGQMNPLSQKPFIAVDSFDINF